jgi:hypothetical protein
MISNPTADEQLASSLLSSLDRLTAPTSNLPQLGLLDQFQRETKLTQNLLANDRPLALARLQRLATACAVIGRPRWALRLLEATTLPNSEIQSSLQRLLRSIAGLKGIHTAAYHQAHSQLRDAALGHYVLVRPSLGFDDGGQGYVVDIYVDRHNPLGPKSQAVDVVFSHRFEDAEFHPRKMVPLNRITAILEAGQMPNWATARLAADTDRDASRRQKLQAAGWTHSRQGNLDRYEAPDGFFAYGLDSAYFELQNRQRQAA